MKMDRRIFLKKTFAAAGAFAVPTIIPSSVFGENAPSNRINIGAIGVGGRGGGHIWRGFVKSQPDVRVVAVCDCFKSRRERHAKKINDHYGSNVCKPMADFREVLARKDVDGVVISTPDHWHVPLAYYAAVAKKDMYVEKPLGVAMAWAWKLRDIIKKNNVVFQYGTQQRSYEVFQRVVNLVRNGYIGKVKHIDAWCAAMRAPGGYANRFNEHYQNTQPAPVPEDLNYDMWIGPAPMKPYTKSRCTPFGSFHIYDYSLGFIAGWGAHPLDIAQWGLNKDHTSPVYYDGKGEMPPKGLFDTVDYWDVNCKYNNDVTMRFMCTRAAKKVLSNIPMGKHMMPVKNHGTRFVGEEGWLCVGRLGVYGSTKELQNKKICDKDTPIYFSNSQARNFIECMKTRKPTISPIESAIRSDTICHMSDISIRLNRPIKWDPKNEKIIGDNEATKMLDRPMRSPWTI